MNNSLLVITSYPPQGKVHGEKVVGIASYAKNTLLSMPKNLDIKVLAEKLANETNHIEENITVERVWKRKSFLLFPILLNYAIKNRDTKNVLIEFEHGMFGEMIHLIPFPLFILLLRLLGKNVTIALHQVFSDMKAISPHININANSKLNFFFNIFFKVFYKAVLIFSTKIIVFEEELKEKLSWHGNSKNIFVIPHGVEKFPKNAISKDEAKSELKLQKNTFIILCFGYLAWYKGTDWIVDKWKVESGKLKVNNIKLIIAGGANPQRLEKEYYKKYVKEIEQKCKENDILLTGFIPEDKISKYFNAADLVVFPYRTFISASGPLSIALSFNKPFIISEQLKEILETKDIKLLISKFQFQKSDLYFENENDFYKKINKIKNDTIYRNKITALSKELAEIRDWEKIGKQYYQTIFS
ncbi:MAG: hypothetical protein A3H79_04730 [Candidatus Levybacteria bacterium RIFCSPLOWO2_02_FULL_36_8b]|nr:MAG: hypothetical protein A3H79_04730 [Candidatus Levybacteria bacterium RIFCSPLOWO2_02_FULL_36_8b]